MYGAPSRAAVLATLMMRALGESLSSGSAARQSRNGASTFTAMVRAVRRADLRSRVAFVPQEGFLFDSTVGDNLRYGDLDASDDDLRTALADLPLPRSDEAVPLDDWAIVGEMGFVEEKLAEYSQRLGATHLIATRLRLPDFPSEEAVRSLEALATRNDA